MCTGVLACVCMWRPDVDSTLCLNALHFFVCLCLWVWWGGQWTACRSLSFPSTTWILGMEPKPWGLVLNTFTCWVILSSLPYFLRQGLSLYLNLAFFASLAGHQILGIPPDSVTSPGPVTHLHEWFLCGCWGSELRCSCVSSQNSAHRVVSPVFLDNNI